MHQNTDRSNCSIFVSRTGAGADRYPEIPDNDKETPWLVST